MMDARRLHILRAMDVDVWVRRELAHVPPVVTAADSMAPPSPSLVPETISSTTTMLSTVPTVKQDWSNAGWGELEQAVRGCTLCGLQTTRTQTVFGVGNRAAEWMVIGEAPGADEDRQGEPFVGRAGQLLNSMLQAMDFPRERVFISNILKCRPPNNRDPRPEEAACCMPYLARQIALVNPRVILCVGRIAAQNLLATDTPIGKLRGKVHRWGPQQLPVVVTYHPAYLLRSPLEKRRAWDDLRMALDVYAATPTRKQVG